MPVPKIHQTPQDRENVSKVLWLLQERVMAKGDWDFRISDLLKNPDVTDI